MLPDDAEVQLSESLTELVSGQTRAVWLSEHTVEKHLGQPATLCGCDLRASGACNGAMLGAIHLYMQQEHFRRSDFEVALSVANLLTLALTNARRFASLRADHQRLVAKSAGFDELIGESKPMLQLKRQDRVEWRAPRGVCSFAAKVVAARNSSHERFTRPAHERIGRCYPSTAPPFLADLMESQLFGHKKGAFTGAEKDHVGWFEQADSGTLFLDEVGEMTLEGQAKLLRILEGHAFLPVGGQKEITVDVRIVAATNRDLSDFVREGRFREDLYYRLTVFELYIPPLRERGADIQVLLDFFLEHFKAQHGRPDLQLSQTPARNYWAITGRGMFASYAT